MPDLGFCLGLLLNFVKGTGQFYNSAMTGRRSMAEKPFRFLFFLRHEMGELES